MVAKSYIGRLLALPTKNINAEVTDRENTPAYYTKELITVAKHSMGRLIALPARNRLRQKCLIIKKHSSLLC